MPYWGMAQYVVHGWHVSVPRCSTTTVARPSCRFGSKTGVAALRLMAPSNVASSRICTAGCFQPWSAALTGPFCPETDALSAFPVCLILTNHVRKHEERPCRLSEHT